MLHKSLSILFMAFILPGALPFAAHAGDAGTTVAASGPKWQEQRADAASFAFDWMVDLDNGDYAAAAKAFRVDADVAESEKILRALREGCEAPPSREYKGAVVIAEATDDSEVKIRVSYLTEFKNRTVYEHMDVLIWHKDPVILNYQLDDM